MSSEAPGTDGAGGLVVSRGDPGEAAFREVRRVPEGVGSACAPAHRLVQTADMAVSLYHLAVDAHDLPALARFWCQVLDWKVLFEDPEEIVIGADETAYPGMCFLPVPERKSVKNRLHLDLNPDDHAAEVERIIGLGARRVDVGQGPDVTFTVLADPEGNEFCVLRPKRSLID